MFVLLVAAPAYLIVGAICCLLLQWHVTEGAPLPVLLWCIATCMVVVPYVCVRHGKLPWTLHMCVERKL